MNVTALLSLSLLAGASAFAPRPAASYPKRRAARSGSALASSYLDSLGGAPATSAAPPSYAANAATPAEDNAAAAAATAAEPFSHASIGYFDVGEMTSKGPRATADWGAPQDATRKLADGGTLSVGAWYCTEGGWPSPNPKAHTEIFYMLDGHGCLGDADGARHYFGPGDTVIIPKGHTGRWDVHTPIHKVWAVNAHERVEETSDPIRMSVAHYHTFAPQYMTNGNGPGLYGAADGGTSRTFYDVGPTRVGVWTCGAGSSFPVVVGDGGGKETFFHLLEGVVFVTDGGDGSSARRCVAGDTVLLPAGWSGRIDVIETAKKLWTTAE